MVSSTSIKSPSMRPSAAKLGAAANPGAEGKSSRNNKVDKNDSNKGNNNPSGLYNSLNLLKKH